MRFVFSFFIFLVTAQFSFAQEAMQLPVDATPLVIKTAAGDVSYNVEVALSRDEHERGLMYRRNFPSDRAMLFKFDEQRDIAMWMANTPLPLDMIFLNHQGVIVSVVEKAVPYSRTILTSGVPARYVIEVNAGQVAMHNIAVGQQVVHPAINDEKPRR